MKTGVSRQLIGATLREVITIVALVVVGFVAIRILLPSLGHHGNARLSLCFRNLRQISVANLEYAQENKDFIPRGGSRMHWAIPVAKQLKFVEEGRYGDVKDLSLSGSEAFRCPTRPRIQGSQFLDYVGNTFDTEKGAENDWQEIREPTKLNLWKHPGKVLYVGDAALESGSDADGANMNGSLKRFRENKQLDCMSVYTPDHIQSSPNRHAGTRIHLDRFANWVFADGHAESVDWKDGQRTTDQWLRIYGVRGSGEDEK